ncbi:MAG TPA: hypothetical protein VKY59_13905 [Spirillospora sp.]|nr:hypothetical protein [Spirillospora sp.]
MDKAITTAIFIVISLIMALALFNIAYPAIIQGGDAIASMTARSEDRMKSQFTIIHAVGELDHSGWWQDTNGNGRFDVFIWAKNTGSMRISALDQIDLFFGPEGNFTRIPHESEANGSFPNWSWTVENGADWTPTATLRITVHYGLPLSSGRYYTKVTIPNGISDSYFLSM